MKRRRRDLQRLDLRKRLRRERALRILREGQHAVAQHDREVKWPVVP